MNPNGRTWLEKRVDEHQNTPEYELEWLLLDLNEAIAGGMERASLSRSELAERLGTSRAYVTKLLDGQENMTLKTLVRVANALEMKVDTRFIPREQAARPSKKARVKTDMRQPSGPAKKAAATASEATKPSPASKTTKRPAKRAVAARSKR
jgi:transcriptional regulator with XRE-family HTH domain